ncbi:NAD(P)/FAD-dependent oxidoreductase [Puia sp.]|jgi:monoamine oxidase|uniref:flavin monoamine oxidase family protein n=1 Tax=Puia sp. TaxID=2045100 RepID=UPI002F414608
MATSIIIIGAGAAGLQAGRRLAEAGHRVILLEAAAEPGGRILRLTPKGFSAPVEGGAEFIHGSLPFSLRLARESGTGLQPVKALMVRRTKGSAWDSGEEGEAGADWGMLMAAMAELTDDIPIAAFLVRHFPGERWSQLRESVRRFAEGYDLADLHRASTRALYREWSAEEDEVEWRPVGGYRPMIDFLVAECRRMGAELHYSSPVTDISWEKGRVAVTTAGGRVFEAGRLVVSVSLGVLETGGLHFHPVLPEMEAAVKRLGYGSVVKILLEFTHPFWLEKKPRDQTLFILSDQPVPTWWTQVDEDSRVLTGWLAGEAMKRWQQLGEAARLDSCPESLAGIFLVEVEWLRKQLVASLMLDWAGAPFVRGGYSFETVEAAESRALLGKGIADTIFFCGEAFYEGEEAPGTVEAALQSGDEAAGKIIRARW